MTTWLITGCSTGLGRALATAVLDAGDNCVVTARKADAVQDLADAHPDTALAVALDVTDAASVQSAVAAATDRFGGVDVLVNNAGYGYRAAVEEGEDAGVQRLFATNVWGPVSMLKAVLPGMRHRRSGVILNISSISARIAPAGSGYYAASKAALEGITFGLAKEVAPLGIRAIVVEPGGFRTDFGGRSIDQSSVRIDDYEDTVGSRRPVAGVNPSLQAKGDPAKAAQVLIELVRSDASPQLFCLGSDSVEVVDKALHSLLSDIDAHRDQSSSTDA